MRRLKSKAQSSPSAYFRNSLTRASGPVTIKSHSHQFGIILHDVFWVGTPPFLSGAFGLLFVLLARTLGSQQDQVLVKDQAQGAVTVAAEQAAFVTQIATSERVELAFRVQGQVAGPCASLTNHRPGLSEEHDCMRQLI